MKVYRFLSEKEYLRILNGEKDKLGNSAFYGKNWTNTHHYKKDIKYIHFFKDKSSIDLIKYIRTLEKQNDIFYICEFDIPYSKPLFHSGKGFYLEHSGYGETSVIEYAIDAKIFDPNWLLSSEKVILSKKIDQTNQELER